MKTKLIRNTPEEDAAITAAALADPDAQPLGDLQGLVRMPGRPRSLDPRQMVSLRVDPDVLARLRASGPGWQTRVNALLRQAVAKGKV
jgi:uncharacterized protein (DUF4415 family)